MMGVSRFGIRALTSTTIGIVFTFGLSSDAAATPFIDHTGTFSVMIGDNDGFGFGLPDDGVVATGSDFTAMVQSLAEAGDTYGAQYTDTYTLAAGARVLLATGLRFESLSWTVDLGFVGANDPFDPIKVYYYGVLQPDLINDIVVTTNSTQRTYVVPTDLLHTFSPVTGEFVVSIDADTATAPLIAYDFFRFDGVVGLDPRFAPDPAVPEPGTLALLSTGIGLVVRRRLRGQRNNARTTVAPTFKRAIRATDSNSH